MVSIDITIARNIHMPSGLLFRPTIRWNCWLFVRLIVYSFVVCFIVNRILLSNLYFSERFFFSSKHCETQTALVFYFVCFACYEMLKLKICSTLFFHRDFKNSLVSNFPFTILFPYDGKHMTFNFHYLQQQKKFLHAIASLYRSDSKGIISSELPKSIVHNSPFLLQSIQTISLDFQFVSDK